MEFFSKRKIILFTITCIVFSLIEVAGISSMIPIIQFLSGSDISKAEYFRYYVLISENILNFTPSANFFIYLLCALLTLAGIGRIFFLYILTFTAQYLRHSLSKKIITHVMCDPYLKVISKSESDLMSSMLSEMEIVINSRVTPSLQLTFHCTFLIFISIFLIYYNSSVTFIVLSILAAYYLFVFAISHTALKKLSSTRLKTNTLRASIISLSIRAAREIRVMKRHPDLLSEFSHVSKNFCKTIASSLLISQTPKLVFETLIFLILVLFLFFNADQQGSGRSDTFETIGVYLIAGYRMLPSVQQIFQNISQLRFGQTAAQNIKNEIYYPVSVSSVATPSLDCDFPIQHEQLIEIKNLNVQLGEHLILKNIDCSFNLGDKVLVKGPSGSGKSTLLNCLMGLIPMQNAVITVGGRPVNSLSSMRFAYVPQKVPLVMGSIEENITFHFSENQVCEERLKSAINISGLRELIDESAADMILDPDGSNLSSGQLQRIGIARALYSDPDILILDEATNSIDPHAEEKILQNLFQHLKRKTIFLVEHKGVGHRLCSKIWSIKTGSLQNES